MANPFLDKAATQVTKTVVDTATPALRVAQKPSTTAQSYDSTAPNFVNKAFSGVGGAFGGGGASGSWDVPLPVASYSNEGRSVPALKELVPAYGNEGRSVPAFKPLTPLAPTIGKQSTKPTPNDEDNGMFGYKVRLFAVRNFPQERVIFRVSPTLTESRSVDYASVNPVHMPGGIQVYRRTNSRTWSLTAKFISRNTDQADENMMFLQQLRGWTMPYFGIRSHFEADTTAADANKGGATALMDTGSMLGAPPDVLYLYAYSDSKGANKSGSNNVDRPAGNTSTQVNLKKIPVVITSLNFSYPDDVDYIASSSGTPFPVRMEVTIELTETHSPRGYEEFSLSMFKQGRLVQF